MANRYYQPVRSEEINYYAPLPTNDLLQIGSVMAGRADKARKDLAEYVDKYSKFRSPSQTDTQRYYNLTMGRIKPVVDQMVSNPDLIKTAEGRSRIAGAINSADFASLSTLEQSRDNMLRRQALEQELSAKGQYNPYWHGIDYTNYDTGTAGVFNNLNLTPWESIKTGTNQYFDNLKDSYLSKSNNVWTWTGVDEKTLRDTAAKNVNAYAQTQAGQMHMKEAIARGLTTKENAQDWLKEQMVQSNREYIRENQTLNPLFQLNMTLAAQNARDGRKASGKDTENGGFSKSQQIITALNRQSSDTRITPNKGFHDYLDRLQKADPIKFRKDVINAMKAQDTDTGMQEIIGAALAGNLMDQASLAKIYSDFATDRNNQINRNVFSEQGYADRFKLEENSDAVRQYYNIDLDSPQGKQKNFEMSDGSGRNLGMYGRVSPSTLVGAIPISSNGKLMSEMTAEGLQINPNVNPEIAGFAASKRRGGNGIKREENAINKMASINNGIIKYITGNSSKFGNNIYMEPTNEISLIKTGQGPNDYNSTAYGRVMLPKKEFLQVLDNYAKDNKLDLDGKDLLKILEGKSVRDFKVVDVIDGAKAYKYNDSRKETPDFKEDMISMQMAIPFLDDANRRVNLDNTYNKQYFGTTGSRGSLDYQLDYNFSPEAVQNSGGITPLNQ